MKLMQIIKEEVVPLSRRQHVLLLIIIACLFQFALFYTPALADEAIKQANIKSNSLKMANKSQELIITTDSIIKDQTMDQEAAKIASSSPARKVKKTMSRVITAYNSEVAQTDNDPCTTANGFNLCKHNQEDSIAANFLPFGTEVMIPDLFGDRVFVVRDRMNSRHANRVDVWMKERHDAIKFGIQVATIQVLE